MSEYYSSSLTMTYASAFFELARERQLTDAVLEDVEGLSMILEQLPDFARFMESPAVNITTKERFLDTLFLDRVQPLTLHFLKVICRKERMDRLAGILTDVQNLQRRAQGRLKGVITTAIDLSASQRLTITEQLSQKTGKPIDLDFQVNPDIIGGLVLDMDGLRVDGSIQRKLSRLTRHVMDQVQKQTNLTDRFSSQS